MEITEISPYLLLWATSNPMKIIKMQAEVLPIPSAAEQSAASVSLLNTAKSS